MCEDDDSAQRNNNQCGVAVTLCIVAETGNQLRNDDAGNRVTQSGAHSACGRKGSTLGVIGGHSAQQTSHGDVHHGVACLADDLQTEQGDNHCPAAAQVSRNEEETDGSEEQHGDGGKDPGTELVFSMFGACEHNVHDGAHQRVVYGIPDVPDQKYGCQDRRIYCQVYLQVAGHIGPDQTYGNTSACVTAAVAENIVPSRWRDG